MADIEVLEDVRMRRAMYIGNTDLYGLHDLSMSWSTNSVDEARAGHCDRIAVAIHADGPSPCGTTGAASPVDLQPQLRKSALEVEMTVLHTRYKFGGSYKVWAPAWSTR